MTANSPTHEASGRQRRFRSGTWVAAVLVGVFAAWQFLGNLDGEPFFPDEQSLVAQAYYWNLYLGRAPAVPRDAWNDTDWLRYPAYDHPPLTKYLIGLGMNVGGAPVPEDLGPWFQWLHGNYARPNGLYWARMPVALCGVAACLALFVLGVLVRGRLVGFTAAVLLAANPLFYTLARRAMRDVPAESFVLATVLLACWMWPRLFAPSPSGPGKRNWRCVLRRWIGFASGTGALAALATLSRLTGALGLLLAATITLAAALATLARRLSAEPNNASTEAQSAAASSTGAPFPLAHLAPVVPALALMTAVGLGVMWLLNPFLHSAPSPERIALAVRERRLGRLIGDDRVQQFAAMGFVQRLRWLPEFRMNWSRDALDNAQVNRFDDWRLRSLGARIRAVVWQGFGRYSLLGRRRRNWSHELTDPNTAEKVELFASCLWPHRHANTGRPGAETKRGFPCLWPAVVFFPLTLWGLACMLRDGWRAWRSDRAPVVWGAALYVTANLASVPLYIPLAWDRYFLPVVSASALAIAYGVAALLCWFGGLFVLQPPAE